ncbi:hypothetical protein KKE14_02745 [Patescibacteria group bacterium]|nr:hypothetical protein [Patescibacteria group bacterium]
MASSKASIVWECPMCKKKSTVEINGVVDPFDVMLMIKADHESVSPNCEQDVDKIKLINPPDFRHSLASY